MFLDFTNHPYECAEGGEDGASFTRRNGCEDLLEFCLPRSSDVGDRFAAGVGQMNLNDPGIFRIPIPHDPTALLEGADDSADGAFFELQARGKTVLRKPRLPIEFEERMGFSDGNWLTAWSSVGLMQAQCGD
jgi:hypothetical protein